MKCKTCGREMVHPLTIIINGIEYETETHDFNKKLSDIQIPKGWRLWTAEECMKLHNDPLLRAELHLEDCWFFIEQPFTFNKDKELVAGFVAGSDRAFLIYYWDPSVSGSSLGVRFCREKKKVKK